MSRLELLDRVEQVARETPRRRAYVEAANGRSIDYGALFEQVSALRRIIPAANPGDDFIVILRCPNQVEYAIWFLAILGAGGSAFCVSTELTHAELRELAIRCGARAIVAESAAREALKHDIPISWPIELALEVAPSAPTPASASPGDLLLASSGTTGEPKIVRRSAAAIDAVSRNMVEAIGFTADDVVLAAVPLTHSYGVEHGMLAPLWAGSTVQLCDGMDLPVMTRALTQGVTVFPAVPAMIEMLSDVSNGLTELTRLRIAYSAGAPLPQGVYDGFLRRFGVRVGQLYGMSEIGSITFNHPVGNQFDPRSVGQPMRDVSIRILDVGPDRRELPIGEDGEVAIRAPSMLREYVGEKAPLVDGHFRTGDLGRLDATGNLTLTGRVRLLIDTGGMKVNPIEVESVLASHPQVLECVVVPVKQSQTVQRLCALIVPRNASSPPSSDSIRTFAKEKLAAYKVPRLVEFRPTLPRTATGKIIRHLLEIA